MYNGTERDYSLQKTLIIEITTGNSTQRYFTSNKQRKINFIQNIDDEELLAAEKMYRGKRATRV